jgi:hypothetical protein
MTLRHLIELAGQRCHLILASPFSPPDFVRLRTATTSLPASPKPTPTPLT